VLPLKIPNLHNVLLGISYSFSISYSIPPTTLLSIPLILLRIQALNSFLVDSKTAAPYLGEVLEGVINSRELRKMKKVFEEK
jgi:hypothetical protein